MNRNPDDSRETPEAGTDEKANGETASRRPQGSLFRHGSILSLLTLVSRILGLLREMTKASLLGTTALADAFSVAFMLPNLFRRLFAEGSIAVAFIPTFKEYLLRDDKKENREFLSCILTFLTFFVTLAVMAGILAAPLIIRLFGMAEFDETVLLTRIMFPFLGFISIAALFQGILNSLRIFAPSGLAPIVLNIVTIIFAWGLSPFTANPARAMAYGVLAGGFLETALQLPFVLKNGQRFFFTSLKKAFSNPGTRKVLRLIAPTIIGMAAYQLNDIVSVALAGNAGEGVVSSLQYSLRLQELILGIFAVSIGTVLLPDLAEHAKSACWEEYNKKLGLSIHIIVLISIPVTFFSMTQGEILIRLLFQNRLFDETSVALTLSAFTFHMPGLFFIALNRIIAPAFYAQSDSKSPTLAGIFSFIVNMVLAAVLVGRFRGAGIALALTIAGAVNTLLLLFFLRRNRHIAVKHILGSSALYTLKILFFSVIAVLPVKYLSPFLIRLFDGGNRIVSLGIPMTINAFVFTAIGALLLFVSKDKILFDLLRKVRRKKLSAGM